MKITSAQCRAARALISWSQGDLAEKAKVAAATIANFETDKRQPQARTLEAMREALEAGGVTFTNGSEPGVKLKAKKRKR